MTDCIPGKGTDDPSYVDVPIRSQNRREYPINEISTRGFMPLIEAIWADEVEVNAPINQLGHVLQQDMLCTTSRQMAEQTLCSMDPNVVETLNRGNIAQKYQRRKWTIVNLILY